MAEGRESPLQEKIRQAVRPLTENDECRLKTIGNGFTFRMDQIEVVLQSENMRFIFHGDHAPSFPAISCRFCIPSVNRIFFAENLFSTAGIDIEFGITDPRYSIGKSRPIMEIDLLDFSADLERLCREMKKNWKKISTLFSPDMINDTIRRYDREVDRRGIHNQQIPPHFPAKDPAPDGTASRKSIPEVPDFKDILDAMAPLDNVSKYCSMILYVDEGRIDVTDHFNFGSHAEYLFHTKQDGTMDVYFIATPWRNNQYHRTTNTSILLPGDPERVVFSLKNLAGMLNIGYVYHPKDILSDLRAYCLVISNNAEKISTALDYDHLKETYCLLRDCPGNNQDEIIALLENVDVFYD